MSAPGIYQGALGVRIVQAQRGPIGRTGSGSTLYRATAEALSGQRVVKDVGGTLCDYADPSNPADAPLVLGILTHAFLANTPAEIQVEGDMEEPSWAWTPGLPVFCGPLGQLTQSVPASGWLMRVGVAVAPTQIVIGLQLAIQL